MIGRWYPPAGAVVVQAAAQIHCATCDTTLRCGTGRNAVRMAERHRCPAGTPGAVPGCPTCDATNGPCHLLNGTTTDLWHPERTRLYNEAARS